MSQTMTPVVPVIEPAVEEFVKARDLEVPFRHMVQKTPELFPTARSIRIYLRPDPEIVDYWFLIFEVRVLKSDVPDFLVADRRWGGEYIRSYPPPIQQNFSLRIVREEA